MLAGVAEARTVRWAASGDPNTMDPHSQNVGTVTMVLQQVYDALIARTQQLGLEPGLALSWTQEEPTRWRFVLRQGVRFHEGEAFTGRGRGLQHHPRPAADQQLRHLRRHDRARGGGGRHTLDIVTKTPDPILPNKLASVFMMSKSWSEQHNATRPQNTRNREEMHTVRNTNGTGAYRLASREPDVRTVLPATTPGGAGRAPGTNGNVTRSSSGRSQRRDAGGGAALERDRLRARSAACRTSSGCAQAPNTRVLEGPRCGRCSSPWTPAATSCCTATCAAATRCATCACGRRSTTRSTSRRSTAPSCAASPCHRHALPEQVQGFVREEDVRLPFDAARARTLLAEAGYPNGFEITLDCSNNRYINDEQICQAIVADVGTGRRARAAERHADRARSSPRSSGMTHPSTCWAGACRRWMRCIPSSRCSHAQRAPGRWHLELRPLLEPADGRADPADEGGDRPAEAGRHPPSAAPVPRGRAAHPAAPPDDPLGDALDAEHAAHGEQPALLPMGRDELMFSFIVSRLLQALPVMLVVSLISFAMFAYVGDPVSIMLGQDYTEAQRQALVAELGLDKPFFVQFLTFLGNAVQGEFGLSYRLSRPVAQLIGERAPATLELRSAPP
jgi:peptide/nickel transport system substrate-binding protein